MVNIRIDAAMSINIRYRLIQFVEILLWLGAAAGLGQIASRLWNMRDQGWRAMLDVAVPGLLGIGAGMAALIVLIGIYHNTRRQGEALQLMAKQGAGGMRRLPGVARGEVAAAAAAEPRAVFAAPEPAYPQQPAPAPSYAPQPAPAPAVARATPAADPVHSTPTLVESAPVIPHAEPAPQIIEPPAEHRLATAKPVAPAPVLRAASRRLGPAN